MAKVLACPSCGYKHSLEILVGLDSFSCHDCGRKLAVPAAAQSIMKTEVAPPEKSAPVEKAPAPKVEDKVEVKQEGIIVVARSSMSESEIVRQSPEVEPIVVSETNQDAQVPPEPAKALPQDKPQIQRRPNLRMPIPFVANVASWVLSIPIGFLIVVIIPRFFGYGFHASDFVDVITTQGLGRYKVVVSLIVLWSIVTAICVGFCHYLARRFFAARNNMA